MKWAKQIFLIVVACFMMNGAIANDISIDELSQEARVSSTPVNIEGVDLSKLSNSDVSMNQYYAVCPNCFNSGLSKLYAEHKGFYPDLHKDSGSPLGSITSTWSVILLSFVGTVILVLVILGIGYKMTGSNKDFMLKFSLLTLLLAVVFQPSVMFPATGLYHTGYLSTITWFGRSVDVRMMGSDKANDNNKAVYQEQKVLNYYDTTDSNLIWNANVEDTTKSTLLYTHNRALGKNGWFNMESSITKGEVLNIIENSISVKPVNQYKDGVVESTQMKWNESFPEYNVKQFGSANILFPIDSSESDSQIENLDNDYVRVVKKMAETDGQNAFTADSLYANLVRVESVVLTMMQSGEENKADRYFDEQINQVASNSMQQGLKSVYDKFKSEGLSGNEMLSLYRAYGKQWIKSANGLNPQNTILGKWKFAHKSKYYLKAYNCSQYFKENEDNIKRLAAFNAIGAGTRWADMWKEAVLTYQCISIQNGKGIFVGVDPETSKEKVDEFKLKLAAAAGALNLVKSNIIQGADNGQRVFSGQYNPYKNQIVSNWDMGVITGIGLNTEYLGRLLNGSSLLNASFRNAMTVGRYTEQNAVGVDFGKLYGEDIDKESDGESRYSYIENYYKRLIFDQIVSPKNAVSIKSFEQAKNANTTGVGEMLVNFMQNRSTVLTNFKEDLGLPQNMSIGEGMRYCNQNKTDCDAKATGTVSGLYRSDVMEFGIYSKMAAVLIKALDNIDLDMKGTAFSGVASVLNKIPGIGVILSLISGLVKLLAVFAVLLDMIGNAFILIGTWSMLLKILPMVQAFQLQAMMPVMLIEFILIIYVFGALSVIKREPRILLQGGKMILSIHFGVAFWIIGYYFMLGLIYYIGIGPLQRGVYSNFASDGDVAAMIQGMFAVYVSTALLHTTYLLIPKFCMGISARLFNVGDSGYSKMADIKQLETLAITWLAEKGIIKSTDKISNEIQKGGKTLWERGKSKYFPEKEKPVKNGPPPQETVTEGVN